MTYKSLRSWVESQQQEDQEPKALQLLKSKLYKRPFFIWDLAHKNLLKPSPHCCFNHIISLPKKDGKEMPLFDYERMLFYALMIPGYLNGRPGVGKMGYTVQEHRDKEKRSKDDYLYDFKLKHVAILKASKLGISEFVLRFLLWLCLRNNDLKDSQMIIFTGPRLELAVSLLSRMRDMLKPHGIFFSEKESLLRINSVDILAIPSHHADSARSYPNISAVMVDEASFIPDREIDNIMSICARNIPASNPYLIALSTPQKPGDFMDRILSEPFETRIWKKMHLDYTYGLGKIYTQEEIDKVKNTSSSSFEREFNLKFAGISGNVMDPEAIDRCISTGDTLAKTAPLDDWSIPTKYVMSIDIGWGSSRTAVMVSRFISGKVQIIYSREYSRPVFADIISEIWRLKNKCNGNLQNILMDASATELYTTLCNEFDQSPSLKYLKEKQEWCKKVNSHLESYLFVVPIPFNPQAKYMLNHTQRMMQETEDDGSAMVGLHSSFTDLIHACRSSYIENERLNKERGIFADSFDAL